MPANVYIQQSVNMSAANAAQQGANAALMNQVLDYQRKELTAETLAPQDNYPVRAQSNSVTTIDFIVICAFILAIICMFDYFIYKDHKMTKEFEEKMKKYSQNPKGGTVTTWE